MPNNQHEIRFRIKDVSYNFGTAAVEPVLILHICGFEFDCYKNEVGCSSFVDFSSHATRSLWLCLDQPMFAQMTDQAWNGTPEDVPRLKRLLVGREFYLNLAMKSANEAEARQELVTA